MCARPGNLLSGKAGLCKGQDLGVGLGVCGV